MSLNLKYGNNILTKEKVSELLKNNVTWDAFVWYISDYSYIKSFGKDWVLVNIVSDKQANFLKFKVLSYNEKIDFNKYISETKDIDIFSKKKGAINNFQVLEKLIS